MKTAILFANWIQDNKYFKSTYTHPSKVGKWFSNNFDTGYLNDEELYELFEVSYLNYKSK